MLNSFDTVVFAILWFSCGLGRFDAKECCPDRFSAWMQLLVNDVLKKELRYNNADACAGNGGEWKMQDAYNEPPPECTGGITSRDNHNGNVKNGHPWLAWHFIRKKALGVVIC